MTTGVESEDQIKLFEVRIRNFRSLQQVDVTLEPLILSIVFAMH